MKNNDYLIHYGVLGMKWGQRRARRKGKEYRYTSFNTKRHQKQANKLRAKASKAKDRKSKAILNAEADSRQRKANASQQYDDLQSKYAKEQAKVGTSIVAGILLNGSGVRNSYQRMRATGAPKVGAAIVAGLFGDIAGRVHKHVYIESHS